MLLGFFTYKAAVIAKTGLSLLDSITKGTDMTTEVSSAAEQQSSTLNTSYSQQILTK